MFRFLRKLSPRPREKKFSQGVVEEAGGVEDQTISRLGGREGGISGE